MLYLERMKSRHMKFQSLFQNGWTEYKENTLKNLNTCALIKDPNRGSKFEWRNDILWYKGRIYLNPTSRFKTKVMIESHDSPTVGHVGFFKTYYNAI